MISTLTVKYNDISFQHFQFSIFLISWWYSLAYHDMNSLCQVWSGYYEWWVDCFIFRLIFLFISLGYKFNVSRILWCIRWCIHFVSKHLLVWYQQAFTVLSWELPFQSQCYYRAYVGYWLKSNLKNTHVSMWIDV